MTTRYAILTWTVCLTVIAAAAQNRGAGPANTSLAPDGAALHLENGLAIRAVLITPLDAKRNKKGSVVVAKTTQDIQQNGALVLQKGSELRGHVTQVQSHTSQSADSKIGFIFDHVVAKGSHDLIPVNLAIQKFGTDVAAAGTRNEKIITASGENVRLATGIPMTLQVTP